MSRWADLRWRSFLILGAALAAGAGPCPGQAPIEPLRVCELLENLSAHEGKVVAIQGRYSFRENGRFLGEESCGRPLTANDIVWPNALRVVFDPKSAPSLAGNLEFRAASVYRNLKLIRERTSLGKFRFGSVDYDRWAVVYGRVEISKEFKAGARPPAGRKSPFEPAPAQVVSTGESMILFLAEDGR
jgi:hypothetical protein